MIVNLRGVREAPTAFAIPTYVFIGSVGVMIVVGVIQLDIVSVFILFSLGATFTVIAPYIVGHWWESLLHNRRARRIAPQLMLLHGMRITLVPWLLDSSELIYGRRSRSLPGDDRAGRIPKQGLVANIDQPA